MDISGLRSFLSEENIKMHQGYLKNLKLRYSLSEKSIQNLKGKSMDEVRRMGIKKSVKEELLALLSEIKLHECYFRSFSSASSTSELIKKHYGSDSSFRYELLVCARESPGDFLCVFLRGRSTPEIRACRKDFLAHRAEMPSLALDLCEHAYFFDYGYGKEAYLRAAISHLDCSKLSVSP